MHYEKHSREKHSALCIMRNTLVEEHIGYEHDRGLSKLNPLQELWFLLKIKTRIVLISREVKVSAVIFSGFTFSSECISFALKC